MNMFSFTGFLCGCIGGVFPLLKCFPVIFALFSAFIIRRNVIEVEFISRYSASQLVIIFMLFI
jgi:hypothetical protein